MADSDTSAVQISSEGNDDEGGADAAPGDDGPSEADLIAVAKAAKGDAAKSEADPEASLTDKERAVARAKAEAEAKQAEVDAKADPEADSDDAPKDEPKAKSAIERLNELVKARGRAHKAKAEAEQAKADALRERQAVEQERRQLAAERAKFARVLENPVEGLREGWNINPDDVISRAVKENSPEAQVRHEIATLRKAQADQKAAYEAEIQRIEQERQREQATFKQARQAAQERAFVTRIRSEAPHATALYGSDAALINEGYRVIDECRAAGIEGVSNDDVIEYLEIKAAERVAEIRKIGTSGANGSNPPKAVNGKRNASQVATSERRSSPVSIVDLPEAEQERELIRVAKEAKRSYRG